MSFNDPDFNGIKKSMFQKNSKTPCEFGQFLAARYCPVFHQYFCSLVISSIRIWLVVSTPLKNISQIGNLPQIGVNKKCLKPPGRYPSITSWWLVQPTHLKKYAKVNLDSFPPGIRGGKKHILELNQHPNNQSEEHDLCAWKYGRKTGNVQCSTFCWGILG